MAGFEVVVRPVVLPNIRPTSPRVLAPESDPTQGLAVINGSGGKSIDLPHTWSVSLSRQLGLVETKRVFNKERVYQVEQKPGGASIMHLDNYVDLERLKHIRVDNADGAQKITYSDPPKADNVQPLATDVTR